MTMSDLELDKVYQRKSKGKKVKLIQEWLCLNGIQVAVDGDFGPATEAAVRQFQDREGLATDGAGAVGPETFASLIQPMTAAMAAISADDKSLGEMIVSYAEQHLQQHPREIGGQNRGPWVRLYMNGRDGPKRLWCAGFACYLLEQACQTLGVSLPLTPSFSCDKLAANAKREGIFVGESDVDDSSQITTGSFFLNRKTSTDWVHTGIVISAESDVFQTIEGNTNDDGSSEGYEVCQRIRGYRKKDFIVW
jgi:hypothetical protein